MKIHKSQGGFSPLHILLLLVLLGIIGFAGWKVYDTNKSTKVASYGGSQMPSAKKDESKIMEGLVEYRNNDLGIKFTYPKEWGQASVKDGEFITPGHGSYKQIVFDKKDSVDINFVLAGFSSPLDACGYSGEPLTFEKYELDARRSSLIGWDTQKNLIILYGPSQGDPNEQVVLAGSTPSNNVEGFELLKVDNRVLVYKDLQKQTWKATSGAEAEVCGEVTQDTADQANLFRKYIHFAVNFSTGKIRGVNAQYDARNTYDQKITDQLGTVLNAIESL